jgi:hypothetical protein
MARLALAAGVTAAFTIGGAFLGVPWVGFRVGLVVGGALGNVLFPVKLPDQKGPRLNDLTVSSAANGTPIPIGFGTYRLGGQIIWSPGLVEHAKTTKQSAKGGPTYSTTNYTYTASFAVAFGESFGTTVGNRYGDIKKTWFDTKVVYDTTTGTNTSKYPAPTIYHGTETQNPDPAIQADKGISATPAFRGLIYGVWTDMPLGDFSNRIPNIQSLVQFGQ